LNRIIAAVTRLSAAARVCWFQATVAKTAEPMEGDRPGKAVAGLALVQLGSDGTAQSRILEPAEREQRALDPPDLRSAAARLFCWR
jgi:hypothetical protein